MNKLENAELINKLSALDSGELMYVLGSVDTFHQMNNVHEDSEREKQTLRVTERKSC